MTWMSVVWQACVWPSSGSVLYSDHARRRAFIYINIIYVLEYKEDHVNCTLKFNIFVNRNEPRARYRLFTDLCRDGNLRSFDSELNLANCRCSWSSPFYSRTTFNNDDNDDKLWSKSNAILHVLALTFTVCVRLFHPWRRRSATFSGCK